LEEGCYRRWTCQNLELNENLDSWHNVFIIILFSCFHAIDRSGLFTLTVLCSRGSFFILIFSAFRPILFLLAGDDKGGDLSDESERWDA